MTNVLDYREALIAWDPNSDCVRVGPLIPDYEAPDWTDHPHKYRMTGGAAFPSARKATDAEAQVLLLREFFLLVAVYRVDLKAVHRAFMGISQYREEWASKIDMDTHDPRFEEIVARNFAWDCKPKGTP